MPIEPIDEYRSVTILSGQPRTDAIDLGGARLCGIIFPGSMTNTAVKVMASNAYGGTYTAIQASEASGANDYSIAVVTGKPVPVSNLAVTAAWRFIKIEGASNESADRTLILALRPV